MRCSPPLELRYVKEQPDSNLLFHIFRNSASGFQKALYDTFIFVLHEGTRQE